MKKLKIELHPQDVKVARRIINAYSTKGINPIIEAVTNPRRGRCGCALGVLGYVWGYPLFDSPKAWHKHCLDHTTCTVTDFLTDVSWFPKSIGLVRSNAELWCDGLTYGFDTGLPKRSQTTKSFQRGNAVGRYVRRYLKNKGRM